ncbi:MAG: hypothetical protein EOM25_06520 [Deltaproteobacteria bacterium]|nr:hypothetical protein [Deltaproteobacteria bacterium]
MTELNVTLKKPLEKMTAKELKALAMDQIPQITGASGMEKEALLAAIKEALGIVDDENKINPYKSRIHQIKKDIRELKVSKDGLGPEAKAQRDALRKKIKGLKKTTRRLASA